MTKTAYFAWGKFQPPHMGHKKVIDYGRQLANENGASFFIFSPLPSNGFPLCATQKFDMLKDCFDHVYMVKTLDEAIRSLYSWKYDEINALIGQDRFPEFQRIMSRFADELGIKANAIMAGERHAGEGIEGMSSTKMRQFVDDGDKVSFLANYPGSFKFANNLFLKMKLS